MDTIEEFKPYVEKFLDDIDFVCREYGLTISHEDTHGLFIVEDYSEHNIDWLKSAVVEVTNVPVFCLYNYHN